MRHSTFGLHVFVSAAMLLGIGFSHAEAQWHYYYFDQPQPLSIDSGKVAVFLEDERGVDILAPSLSKHGIQAADVRASVMPGLSFVRLPASARSESGVLTLVKAIADDNPSAFPSPVFLNEGGDPVIITRHLHIGFHPHVSAAEAEKLLAASGAGTIEERDWARMKGVYRVRCGLRDGFGVLELANALAQRPEVRFAEPDKVIKVHEGLMPNDPLFPSVWGLHNTGGGGAVADMDIDAPEAWDITTGDSDVVVVIIDNGVQQDHPDLNQRPGADFTGTSPGGGPYNQCDDHGTAVAGCVSAIINNGLGTVGVAPDATVAGAKVGIANVVCSGGPQEDSECVVDSECFACAGGEREGLWCEIDDACPESYCVTSWLCNGCPGTFTMADSWLVTALDWAETIGARVTNCSFSMGGGSSAITNKFEETRAAGLIHFASAGNYSEPVVRYPANLPTVNAVSALDSDGDLASFSSWGEGLAVSAPGVNLWSTDRTGSDGYTSSDYTLFGGTSAASPYSSGVAALIISQNPQFKVEDVESALYQTAMDRGPEGYDEEYGWGFANAHQALLWLTGTIRSCDVGQFVASDAEESAEFGQAVAADENAAVIGAPKHDCLAGNDCGAAYVYRWSGGSWAEEQTVTATDADSGDKFGGAVSVSGEVALIGAPGDDYNSESNAGSAYVFRNNGGTWIEEQHLAAAIVSSGAEFGTAVALDGDVALVGSPNEAGGAVYVFRYGGGSWNLEDTLVASDTTTGDDFGTSVSLDGDVAVVGAPSVGCVSGGGCGAAYVYRYGGAAWTQEQKLTASDPQTYDWFGAAVSVYGNRAMIGSPLADTEAGDNSGAVYVFEKSGATWTEEDKVTAPDSKASDYLGWSLAFRNGVGLAGARGLDCAFGDNCGAAHIIRQDEGGNWGVDARLMPPDVEGGDGYGRSVALGAHVVLVGASTRDALGLNASGAVYAYGFPGDCNDNDVADICDILSGYSTDLDGNNRPDECVCEESSPASPELLDLGESDPESQKIRYISFIAGDTGQLQAVRVTFNTMPSPYALWNGTRMWVQEPQEYCENAGTSQADPCPTTVGELPSASFWGAQLGCDPHFGDWTQYDLVHVWHEGIIPDGVYELQVLDSTCSPEMEDGYSEVLTVTQSGWADLINNCTTIPCGPPDGNTGIVDVTAVLDKWKNLPGNVKKVRADLEGSPGGDHRLPDQAINITDVTYCLGAFLGDTYPPFGFPPPSDPPSCSP